MKTTSFTTIAALLVFGIGGFMAGRISSPSDKSDPTGKDGPAMAGSSRMTGRDSLNSADGPARSGREERQERASRRSGGAEGGDSKARLEAIVRSDNALDRNRALLAFIDQLGPDDFGDAVAHFRSLGITEGRFSEYAMLLTAWAKADPLAALEYAQANTRGGYATGTILSTWASSDADAAIRWAEANHGGEGANPHFAGIIRSLGASDPMRATQLLTGMPRSEERGQALDAFLPHLLARGGNSARDWIDSLSDEALRNGAMIRVADRLAADDPAGTAAWLLANQGEASQRSMDDVYSVWARQDEQAALRSMAALPAGENRSNALRGLITSVASRDPQAAVSMMDRFPNDVNDRVVQNFVWHSFGNDPSVAVNQIARIGNQGERERMYRRMIDTWLQRDENSALAWIQRNPLPGPVQDHINRRLNERSSQ